MFSFYDTNFMDKPNHPEIVATLDTYNGYQFKLSGDTAVPNATADDVKAAETYIMLNIIDKPDLDNTSDYYVTAGEYIRAYRTKDLADLSFNMSSELATDTYSTVSVGDTFVGRSTADTTDTMKWKKVASVAGYSVYLEVLKKTTYGAFTYQNGVGTIPGGYLVKLHVVDLVA